MNYSEDQLIQKFLQTIPSDPANTKKLFGLGFVGLPGSGKSFVAQKISQRLNLYVANNDKIRRFLNELGFTGESPIQKTVEKIAETVSRYLFENKISHILDADLIYFHNKAIETASDYGANFYIIQITCPEEIILNRIKNRMEEAKTGAQANFSTAGEDKYFERKKLHATLPLPNFFDKIDSSKNLETQIENLISKLKEQKII